MISSSQSELKDQQQQSHTKFEIANKVIFHEIIKSHVSDMYGAILHLFFSFCAM